MNVQPYLWKQSNADAVAAVPTVAATEQRSIENPATPITDIDSWTDWVGGSPNSQAGVRVSPDSALGVTAVYSAVNIISNAIAIMPISLKRETELGWELVKDHPAAKLLRRRPNKFQTWTQFKRHMTATALLRGNSYALIVRNGAGKPTELLFLEPGDCDPVYMKIGSVRYLYYYVDGRMVEPRDIIHISCLGTNGIIGKSPIALAAEAVGLSLAAETFGARFFGSGANSSGGFSTSGTLSDQAYKRLLNQLKRKYAGLRNSHEPLLLEAGLKYERFSIPPNEAQFIEARGFQVKEIARMYLIPAYKLQADDQPADAKGEQQTIDFKAECLLPWAVIFEEELTAKLLLDDETETHRFALDSDYALRANSVDRSQYYMNRFNTGSITSNEIRTREGDNRIENALNDMTFVQSGFQPMREENFTPKPTVTPNTPNEKPKTKRTRTKDTTKGASRVDGGAAGS